MIKMDISDQWNIRARTNVSKCLCRFHTGHRHSDDIGASCRNGIHLGDGRVNVTGFRVRHALHRNRRISANGDIPYVYLPADSALYRRRLLHGYYSPRTQLSCRALLIDSTSLPTTYIQTNLDTSFAMPTRNCSLCPYRPWRWQFRARAADLLAIASGRLLGSRYDTAPLRQ